MALTEQKTNANWPEEEPTVYPTWNTFVQAKVDGANELISRMDQDALRRLIESKQQPKLEK